MRLFPVIALTLFASAAAGAATAASPTTIKVVVSDGSDDGEVNLNLSFATAEAALALAPIDEIRGSTLRIGERDVKVAELRTLWNSVKASGDADLLTARDGGEEVRISAKGGRMLVRVTEKGSSKVHVDVPGELVDALLSGSGDSLNFPAAFAALRSMEPGELVRIDDGADRIRVSLE